MGTTKQRELPQAPPLDGQQLEFLELIWRYLLQSLDPEDVQERIDAAIASLQESLTSGSVEIPDDYLRSRVMASIGFDVTAGKIKLVNDSAAPGSVMFYGTNSSGAKGWQDLLASVPTGGTTQRVVPAGEVVTLADTYCLVVADYYQVDGELQLDGDACLEVI